MICFPSSSLYNLFQCFQIKLEFAIAVLKAPMCFDPHETGIITVILPVEKVVGKIGLGKLCGIVFLVGDTRLSFTIHYWKEVLVSKFIWYFHKAFVVSTYNHLHLASYKRKKYYVFTVRDLYRLNKRQNNYPVSAISIGFFVNFLKLVYWEFKVLKASLISTWAK